VPRARVGASHDDERSVPAGHEEAVARLQAIPNVGPKMAAELVKLGVRRLEDVVGRDPDEMYHELCAPQTPRGTTLA
jgi:predicted flap endonuclease-1-like 5' DNA nuclease